jgi:hypothetical protein
MPPKRAGGNPRAFAEYPQTRLAELVAALVADVVGRRQACRRSGGCQASPPGDVDHRRGAVVPLSQAGDTPRNLPPVRPDSFNALALVIELTPPARDPAVEA